MENKIDKKVHCSTCKYVGIDANFSTSTWDAIECRNADSEYYGCLLNIYYDGSRSHDILWPGCSEWSLKAKAGKKKAKK